MGRRRLHTIELAAPQVNGQTVEFAWTIDPDPGFYRTNGFSISFPESVDPAGVPAALWLRIAIVCLHSHWAMLRPCRVVLPRELTDNEREFWLRLIDAASWTLESFNRQPGEQSYVARTRREVELVSNGPPADPLPPAPAIDDERAVACFSGGRDSLALAALLSEAGMAPLLVTTISHREASREFDTGRFRKTLSEGPRLLNTELLTVHSDLRSGVENGHPLAARYGLAVTEVTDVLLYFVNALVVAWTRGGATVFLAHEFEAEPTVRIDGMVAQVPFFMYSGPTIGALDKLLTPTGIAYRNVLAPLQQHQIQHVLRGLRPELSSLQNSCFMQAGDEEVCSRCSWCFKSALHMLDEDAPPHEAGLDLDRVLIANAGWRPAQIVEGQPFNDARRVEFELIDQQLLRAIRGLEADEVAALTPMGSLSPEAHSAWEQLRTTALAATEPPPRPGFRARYLERIDQPLRGRIEEVMQKHYEREPEENYAEFFSDSRSLAEWIASPLGDG